jgi:hypothetical protein
MNSALHRAHYPVAKPACQGPCSGYGTCSNCPPLIVVAMMLAPGRERLAVPERNELSGLQRRPIETCCSYAVTPPKKSGRANTFNRKEQTEASGATDSHN